MVDGDAAKCFVMMCAFSGQYGAAFTAMRKHRINMNLLYDHNPNVAFMLRYCGCGVFSDFVDVLRVFGCRDRSIENG